MSNIDEEKSVIQQMAQEMNGYSSSPITYGKEMSDEFLIAHRTIQNLMGSALYHMIKALAEKTKNGRNTDARNENMAQWVAKVAQIDQEWWTI